MQSNDFFDFFKTIRFKLTLIYSAIFLFFSISIILLLNIFVGSFLRNDPAEFRPFRNGIIKIVPFDTLALEIKEDIRAIRLNDLKRFQELSFLSILPITVFSFLIGYMVSWKFLRPINDLGKKIEEIESSKLGSEIKYTNSDEVGRLIENFNKMSKRLKIAFDSQLKFVQDASHEIKTPLTIIQTSLDTTLKDSSATKHEILEAIQDALNGVKRLKKITNDLLEITTPFLLEETIFLNDLINEQIKILSNKASQKKVEINITCEEPLQIKGNSLLLGRAFFNIIENAIKYSQNQSGSYLKIEIYKQHNIAVIDFKDNGVGIAPEKREKIFNRFYRERKSSEGNGLGLSISQEIIKKHFGTIELIDSPNETVFQVKLPL